jgi:hypothetical protein
MVQDKARHLVPEKAVWNAYDAFLREDGSLTQRGAAIVAQAAASVISPAHIAILDSNEVDNVTRGILYDESAAAGNPVKTAAFTPGAGTTTISTVLSSINAGWVTPTAGGRPARYFNRILRPNGLPAALSASHGYRPYSIYAGGAHALTSRTGTASITAILGDNVLTGFAIADTAAMEVGNIIQIPGAAFNYVGRIVEIPTTTTIRVSPVPSAAFVSGAVTWSVSSVATPVLRTAATSWICGARSLTVWGNRVVLGGVAYDLLNAGTKLDIKANRLAWSLLPAVESAVVGAFTYDGYREGGVETFLARDFEDVMTIETILGVEPVNANELLVLGSPGIHRVVGYFSTQTTQAGGGLTWEVRPVEDVVEAVSDQATARTPLGIMFAATDGIYLYRGGRAHNVMDGRIKNKWFSELGAGAVVTGGGYLGNNTYYVSTTTTAYLCDLDQFRWTQIGMTGIGGKANDPTIPGRIYGIRRNPGTTNDTTKLFRLDTILNPTVANVTDAHPGWAGPTAKVETRAYTEGDVNRLKRWQHVYVSVKLVTAGTVTVTATPGIDAEETPVVLGTFSASASAQMKVFQIQTNSRAMAIKIERTAGTPSELEVLGLKLTSVPLNEFRSA